MKENNVIDVNDTTETKTSFVEKVSDKALMASAVATTALMTTPAFALEADGATGLESIGEGLSSQLDAAQGIVIALFGTAAVVLGLFTGWRYFKRGANSA